MTAPAPTPPVEDTRWQRVLVLVGIVVLGFNLRPAAVSVGPVLDEITEALDMSGATAGLLTTLPVLAFASFGALAPDLARLAGVHRVGPALDQSPDLCLVSVHTHLDWPTRRNSSITAA